MQQTATVTKLLSGNQAELTVHRQTACGHDCSKCEYKADARASLENLRKFTV